MGFGLAPSNYLSREGAATVCAPSAVRVHDDLAARETSVTLQARHNTSWVIGGGDGRKWRINGECRESEETRAIREPWARR